MGQARMLSGGVLARSTVAVAGVDCLRHWKLLPVASTMSRLSSDSHSTSARCVGRSLRSTPWPPLRHRSTGTNWHAACRATAE